MNTAFKAEKMYTFIRGFASGCRMEQTLKSLAYARSKHAGQLRKSGDPYIVHPLTMACNALSIGVRTMRPSPQSSFTTCAKTAASRPRSFRSTTRCACP